MRGTRSKRPRSRPQPGTLAFHCDLPLRFTENPRSPQLADRTPTYGSHGATGTLPEAMRGVRRTTVRCLWRSLQVRTPVGTESPKAPGGCATHVGRVPPLCSVTTAHLIGNERAELHLDASKVSFHCVSSRHAQFSATTPQPPVPHTPRPRPVHIDRRGLPVFRTRSTCY